MNYLAPARLDALAREHALGTLHGGARRRFDRVVRGHPEAAAAVAGWQRRFDVLADVVPPLAPGVAVWSGLESRLFGAPAATPARWWQALWSGRSLGGALAGILLAAVVLRQQPAWLGLEAATDALPPSYVGLLTDAAGKPSLLASGRRHGRQLTLKVLQPLAVPPGRVARLWALPRDGKPAFAVGDVPARGSATLSLPATAEALFFGVDRLAVSLEPGAAAAAPSAPYVLTGNCVRLW